ncbi:MAG: hypothetical protein EXR33_11960 [Betaproteobacteria bacterium]|nr:hypothetical protein [Betaproteobacteria bacterium]
MLAVETARIIAQAKPAGPRASQQPIVGRLAVVLHVEVVADIPQRRRCDPGLVDQRKIAIGRNKGVDAVAAVGD